jgi:predicted DNA-binding transcriptional regulator AlpA
MNFPGDECVISEREAAQACGFSVVTLRRLISRGEGPPVVRLSERRRGIRIVDLKNWIARNTGQSDTAA